ncbi:hypothetical protein SERLA73DRAFT_192334 [Serpula lacrymans var. lacrymans S7.3]|uniref:Uncharacterized protein n=1 Tax=Serpula lacrymans var. lacrymans (strain S7.3) TaxID=936435 RepID=F8QJW4_SERL3|nr:hypothetical protein SERLA73DRAFT_192334 [Serpula lacrymans var. lacrymans S7.3]
MDGLPPNQRYREHFYRVIDGPNITRSEAQDVEICNRGPIGVKVPKMRTSQRRMEWMDCPQIEGVKCNSIG